MKLTIKPVTLDGLLFVGLSITAVNSAMLASDNAAKFINPFWIFVSLWMNGIADAALLATKMYRSTAYARHRDEVERDETTRLMKAATEPKS